MKPAPQANPGHESSDASPHVIGVIAASLAVGIALVLAVSYGIFAAGRAGRSLAPGLGSHAVFQNGPEERTAIERDWIQIDAETRQHLYGCGWVDRRAGVVRIPIRRAMEVMAEGRR